MACVYLIETKSVWHLKKSCNFKEGIARSANNNLDDNSMIIAGLIILTMYLMGLPMGSDIIGLDKHSRLHVKKEN